MKKIMNDPADFVDEVLEGILLAHAGWLRPVSPDNRALVRASAPFSKKVSIVTGGGSGHLPIFLGYVGEGLCTGVAVGNVFSSPSPEQILQAIRATNSGAGVLLLYGNYGGDVFNFDLAADLAEIEDIETATVVVSDDVASAPKERASTRRGVAGMVFAYKIAGGSADRGDSLNEVTRLARKAIRNTRSMGVGLSSSILPTGGEPTSTLGEHEMEIGIGIHGEPGVHRGALETANQITERLVRAIVDDIELQSGDRIALMVNGLGATPPEELYIMYRRAHQIFESTGIEIYRTYVGEYATSLEMAGASISVLVLDDELATLLDAPAASPFFDQQ